MLFNSFYFIVCFLIVLTPYVVSKHRMQNIILLAASYYFYANWDYRFLSLLLITTLVDYVAALVISSSSSQFQKKTFLSFSIIINLSILVFFKYFNFFITSFTHMISLLGFTLSTHTLQIILPIGISFYTFKSMSYTIDVYRGKAKPTKNIIDYALFVSFFPQLLAGPIERSSQLLNQIIRPRTITFKKMQDGCFYIFWGLFLKVFIADNLANIVDPIFSLQSEQTGFAYLIAGYAYTFQIYGDFAGYSYMAKGLGNILGFEMMDNFHLPYFAHNPQDFWRRWHISLSRWFLDYVYIPMGGSRGGGFWTMRNLFATMLLCGLWHGAQITFVLWGGLHGILLSAHRFLKRSNEKNLSKKENTNTFLHFIKIFLFFHIIVFSWFIFRANSVDQIQCIFLSLVGNFSFNLTEYYLVIKQLLFYVLPLVLIEFFQYYRGAPVPIHQFPVLVRGVLYVIIFYLVVIFGVNDAQNFIYMQF